MPRRGRRGSGTSGRLAPDLVFQIKLVLEELGINIVNHGHDDGRSHEIEIELTSNADALTIEITDDGRPFEPMTDAPPPPPV